ncbi:hypothetical protein [Nocardia arthritidis]|uniref:Uncharacterized protein n=1 Tax=Nocardia arthritidis TaxID=228602 RepID=A0A6G9YR33_9NOCA|nr:hypothetical protein [Nocardia arthritidis]QIS15557.1 hypothetical protein F5544_38680 [Nocardia arthritidis]
MDELSRWAAEIVRIATTDSADELGNAALRLTSSVTDDELVGIILELIRDCGRYLAGDSNADALFGFRASTGNDVPDVDDVHPAIRAASRALLSSMNGDDDSARLHITNVVHMGHPFESAAVVALVASWHVQVTTARWRPVGAARTEDGNRQ